MKAKKEVNCTLFPIFIILFLKNEFFLQIKSYFQNFVNSFLNLNSNEGSVNDLLFMIIFWNEPYYIKKKNLQTYLRTFYRS